MPKKSSIAVGLLAACFALGSVGPVVAASQDELLRDAKRAFDAMDFDEALPLLNRALRESTDPVAEVEIYELLARVHAAYGRLKAAERAFIEVLRRRPTFRLPDSESPKIVAIFEAAQAAQAARVDGVLTHDESSKPTEVGEAETPPPKVEQVAPPVTPLPELPSLPPPEDDELAPPLWAEWWFWAVVGGVALAAGGVTIGVVTAQRLNPPPSDFGPIPLDPY